MPDVLSFTWSSARSGPHSATTNWRNWKPCSTRPNPQVCMQQKVVLMINLPESRVRIGWSAPCTPHTLTVTFCWPMSDLEWMKDRGQSSSLTYLWNGLNTPSCSLCHSSYMMPSHHTVLQEFLCPLHSLFMFRVSHMHKWPTTEIYHQPSLYFFNQKTIYFWRKVLICKTCWLWTHQRFPMPLTPRWWY